MRHLKLTNSDLTTLVDDDVYEQVKDYNWFLSPLGYAMRARLKSDHGNGQKVLLHRYVIGAVNGQYVDHVNRNRLDNTRSNLRFATLKQNVWNSGKRSNSKSKFKGVSPGLSELKSLNIKELHLTRIMANGCAIQGLMENLRI
jgi:hypothetical protein